jgi:hypothetical protein
LSWNGRRHGGPSARNSNGLAAQSREGKRGKRREGGGLLMGAAWGRNGRGINRIEEGSNSLRGNVSGEKSGPRRKTTGRWVPPVGEGREEQGTVSVRDVAGPWASSGAGPNGFPGAHFIFFFLSSLSFFWFSYLLHIFCINASKQIKQFHKFCKIHSKVLNQYQTCFQNQSKVFNKRSWLSLMALLAQNNRV